MLICQLIMAIEGQDGVERIKLLGAIQHRIGGGGQGIGLLHDGIVRGDLAFPN